MMLTHPVRIIGLFVLLITLFPAAPAQRVRRGEAAWELLGEAHVDGAADHDRISVDRRASYRAIQIRVHGSAVEFQRVVIHFNNGADHEVAIRDRIAAGGSTRVIDLPGRDRFIRSVEFWYARGGWGAERPTIRLFGRS